MRVGWSPADLGSSVGVHIVKTKAEGARALRSVWKKSDTALVQEFIKGAELTCGVLEYGRTRTTRALMPTEIVPRVSSFFDYRAKYAVGGSEEITPARVSKEILREAQRIALVAHHALGCRGVSRTDMILKKNTIFVLEVNTIPGMTRESLLPKGAAALGIDFATLVDHIVKSAVRR